MRRKVKLWIAGFFVLFPYNVWATNLLKPPAELTVTLQMLFFITLLALIPSILVMMTSFTRFIISLHFLKSAMGTQQMPPNQIVLGLALFLTFFVMSPVFSQINDEAIIPYRNNQITQQEMLDRSVEPLKEFMIAQARDADIKLFMDLSGRGLIEDETDILSQIPLYVLVPAFIIGELRAGFIIGFLIYLPFIVIDMVIASALMAMGMMMLPPATISLPFKILLFILADGWNLLIGELVLTFN
ncbi:flagellar biosynthetic protein FliP [Candidatus Epulonipiscium fishelsonii]|uniref:Flagellar biosynthetic protein FliP n=1 Tax=Candidatus Epulonipiscium fishelsonii TaxID=77094 RepID=A0ACC8XDR2_9FIRM|nr:flagellar biosynthetic protein FliP [Epulopiscium sp. SCG-B05WGA-EpuloA1]ONI40995.1 flagellar biosynthetic protein FliP [Epulopiscium sp. SCG-B11WGA-EpuloA1]